MLEPRASMERSQNHTMQIAARTTEVADVQQSKVPIKRLQAVSSPLSKVEEAKKKAVEEKKAINSMWKATKNDDRKSAETALAEGAPVDYADTQVHCGG